MTTDDRDGWPLVPPGVWIEIFGSRNATGGPSLFLDRDGVIVEDSGFLKSRADVRLLPGAVALIRSANNARLSVAVVTNQSGIDRGLHGWAEFAEVQAEIGRLLAEEGAHIDAVAACPFHPDHTPGFGPAHAAWRKPRPGMIAALADRLGLEIAESWLIGDRARDIAAASGAGLAGGILLSPSTGPEVAATRNLATSQFSIEIAPDIDAAMRVLPLLPTP